MKAIRDAIYIPNDCDRSDELREQFDAIARAAARYRWLREHPAFETEACLGGLTPEEFDALVDECMK